MVLALGTLFYSRRVHRIEHGPGDRADKVHAIRVWFLGITLAKLPLLFVAMTETEAELSALGVRPTASRITLVALPLLWLGSLIVDAITAMKASQRIKGTNEPPSRTARRALRASLALMIMPLASVPAITLGG